MTIKISNVYCRIDGVFYKNYTLYADGEDIPGFFRKKNDTDLIMNRDLFKDYRAGFPTFLDQNIRPAKGSSLFCCPDLDVAIDDIRKNYAIKRNMDTGDYNVINAKDYIHACCCLYMAIFPSQEAIYLYERTYSSTMKMSEAAIYSKALNHIPDADMEDMICPEDYDTFYMVKDDNGYLKSLLDGSCKKPWVSVSQLDLNSDLELTEDILYSVYLAGTVNTPSVLTLSEADKNLIMQLNVLNQYNWRKYPFTISILNSVLKGSFVFMDVTRAPSKLPKQVRNILATCTGYNYRPSKEDYGMAQSFISHLLGMSDRMFVDADTYRNKVVYGRGNIESIFEKFYDLMIRITPKTYEEAYEA